MPICSECGKVWKPDGRRAKHSRKVICTECYVEIMLKGDGF